MNSDFDDINIPSNFLNGLTNKEAKIRLRNYGRNEIKQKSKTILVFDFLKRFKSPLVLTLIGAAIVSGFLGDKPSAIIIIAIVLVSGSMDFLSSYRAQKAVDALRQKIKVTATVIRDGQTKEVLIAEVVPGDIIKLLPGDIIPADCQVKQTTDFFINESILTGESFPTEKKDGDSIFMGSSVVTGNATAEVLLTGDKTKFGLISDKLKAGDEPTEFDRDIKKFSLLIVKIMFILVIFVFAVNVYHEKNLFTSFLFAIALAVGITPELLPMIITLNLTKGSLAISKHGVIVKKLSAIQNFGSMDILCTDKTGTLTEDRITLVKYIDSTGKDSEEVLKWAYLNSQFQTSISNPLDNAINNFRKIDISDFKKIEEIPFDFTRRRESIVVEHEGEHIMIVKGAPESIFEVCDDCKNNSAFYQQIFEQYRLLSSDGFRILAIAIKKIKNKSESYLKQEEIGLKFVGYVAFFDPPKETATNTLKLLEERKIEIKILTGDNEIVTNKIAQDIKLATKGTLVGEDIEKMSDNDLSKAVENNTIFAKINPDQKTRIIKILQKNGHCIGYIGDGINDAPSLKIADVGISVNNAVDVAKESADFVLLNKSLADLADGVYEGRKTFANTSKYLRMSLSSDFGNMLSMAAASVFIPFFPMLPIQILLNDLLYDMSQTAIPLDNVDSEEIIKPEKFNIDSIKKFMLIFGLLSSFFDFITFLMLYFVFHFSASSFQTGWFLESIATQTLIIFIVRTKISPFYKSHPSKILIFGAVSMVILAWFIALGPFGSIFKFSPLPALAIISTITITILYLATVDFVKSKISFL